MMHYKNSTRRGGISPATERRSMIIKENCREEMIKAFHQEQSELRVGIMRII